MLMHERRAVVRSGFTLLELLVVVAILVILAAAVGVIYMRHLDTAKKDIAKIKARAIAEAVKAYYVQNQGTYPPNLVVMTQPSPDGGKPYLEVEAIMDPWSREFQYTVPGQHHPLTGDPDIFSLGPNPGDPNGIIGDWMK